MFTPTKYLSIPPNFKFLELALTITKIVTQAIYIIFDKEVNYIVTSKAPTSQKTQSSACYSRCQLPFCVSHYCHNVRDLIVLKLLQIQCVYLIFYTAGSHCYKELPPVFTYN